MGGTETPALNQPRIFPREEAVDSPTTDTEPAQPMGLVCSAANPRGMSGLRRHTLAARSGTPGLTRWLKPCREKGDIMPGAWAQVVKEGAT